MSVKEDRLPDLVAIFQKELCNRQLLGERVCRHAETACRQASGDDPLGSEEWQNFTDDVAKLLIETLQTNDGLDVLINFERESLQEISRDYVRLFKEKGCEQESFWELVKSVRIGVLDIVKASSDESEEAFFLLKCARRFFDGLEYQLLSEWMKGDVHLYHRRMREAHHYILLEKRRYHTIFQKIKEPAVVIDGDRKIIDVNVAFQGFYGNSAAEIQGENCCTLIMQKACRDCDLERAMAGCDSFSDIEMDINTGEEKKTVLIAGSYLGLINGRNAGWIIILQDITDKKNMEEQLRESEEKYRSLVQNIPDVTWRSDIDGHILFISPNVEKVTGFTPREIVMGGRDFWVSRVHPEDFEWVSQEIGLLFSCGHLLETKYRFHKKDKTWIWIHELSGKTYMKHGVIMADGVLRDVTHMKKIEEELEQHHLRLAEQVDKRTAELRRTNEILEKQIQERLRVEEELIRLANDLKSSNAELEQFAHVASHDLKEPLLLIIAFGRRLRKKCYDCLDTKGHEYLNRILKAATRMEKLIDDLLLLSRITTRASAFEKIDLDELMQELIQFLEERITKEKAFVKIESLHDLMGDRVQVWQLFMNIITNALKYRKDVDSPVIKVRSQILKNGMCEVTVEDNGIGFEEKYLEDIFTPFKRLHGHGKYEGSGIGLATCKKIVLRHGGEITARSQPGSGSTFIIRLPLPE